MSDKPADSPFFRFAVYFDQKGMAHTVDVRGLTSWRDVCTKVGAASKSPATQWHGSDADTAEEAEKSVKNEYIQHVRDHLARVATLKDYIHGAKP